MQETYNLESPETCSRWAALLECIMIFEKGCEMNRVDSEKEFKKLKPNIILKYIDDRGPQIEKELVENKDGFFINNFLLS
jgi:hypothetical protein